MSLTSATDFVKRASADTAFKQAFLALKAKGVTREGLATLYSKHGYTGYKFSYAEVCQASATASGTDFSWFIDTKEMTSGTVEPTVLP